MSLFSFGSSAGSAADAMAVMRALDKSQAIIHLSPDGIILAANANFLAAMGYALDEIKDKHHSMFVTPE
ncbi:MAG: PAS domain S-box protein, partial [Alsobacter sp.]